MLKENETDTFISVDTELRRVTINCSVYEYGRWKGGRGMRVEILFPIFILVKFLKYPCTHAEKVKYLLITNVKLDMKETSQLMHENDQKYPAPWQGGCH